MHPDTRILHAGYPSHRTPGPYLPGPAFAGTYVAPGDPAQQPFTYGRYHNPTWHAWEAALAELDGGEATAFASGMAAVSAVFGVVLQPGDTLAMLAVRFQVSPATLRSANNLKTDELKVGQVLTIPGTELAAQ